jgi:DNA ligase-1
MSFKPMLAPQEDPRSCTKFFDYLSYPLLASYKLDGIRGVPIAGTVRSRTLKALRSKQVQKKYGKHSWLDGEMIIGEPTDPNQINLCQSHIMSFDKPSPDLRFYVFDCANTLFKDVPFYERLRIAKQLVEDTKDPSIYFLEHKAINSYDELITFEEEALGLGYEGLMLRNPLGRYKHNRATMLDNIIFKLKRFIDDEGLLIGLEEKNTNTNEQVRDERGYAKRSSAKEGLVPAGTAGTFIVEWQGLTLRVAPGKFKHDELQYIWNNQKEFIEKVYVKFRFFGYGMLNMPRFPRAITFRSPEDIV